MKVLLISINAKYIHTNNAVRLLKVNSSFNPEILEYTIKDSNENIIEDIYLNKPEIIAFSVYIWNVEKVKTILSSLQLPNTKIILGGPEVSYDVKHFLNYTKADFIVKGEGEIAFEELLKSINDKTDYSTIPNIAYKDNNKIISNPIHEISDLSIIKAPYYLKEDLHHIQNKIAYIESSRGCPYNCSYCLSSMEEKVRFFPLEYVQKAIQYLMDHGSKTIKFLDRTFNANKNTMAILEHIIKIDNGRTVFQFEITGDVLDKRIIEYLNTHARKGLFRFEIGIQSTNDQTNILVDRYQNTEKLFENIKLIQDAGIIDLHLDLIAGLPLEDLSSFRNTFDSVFRLGTKELQLGFLKMLRGTKIRRESDKYGYEFSPTAPYEIIRNNVLSETDIDEIHRVEHMLQIYHNKGYFRENMHQIILSKPSPYNFFLELHNHLRRNNYITFNYQLADIYQYVFDLLNEEEVYLLKKDYLLRAKTKPKMFFDIFVTRAERKLVVELLSQKYNLPSSMLYTHSRTIKNDEEYFTVLYQNNTSNSVTTKINKTP